MGIFNKLSGDNKQTAVKCKEARDLGLMSHIKAFMGTQSFIFSHTENRVDIKNSIFWTEIEMLQTED